MTYPDVLVDTGHMFLYIIHIRLIVDKDLVSPANVVPGVP